MVMALALATALALFMALAMVMAPGTEPDILMVQVMAAALVMGEARVLNKNHKKNDGEQNGKNTLWFWHW